MTDPQQALIFGMIAASVADQNMRDVELARISEMVAHLPAFAGFDPATLPQIADECVAMLQREDGLDEMFGRIRDALPERLRETAYALACDVVAADGAASQEELRLLEMMRHIVGVDRLSAAAIERGAAARYARL
jgi:tellurite resistance protein